MFGELREKFVTPEEAAKAVVVKESTSKTDIKKQNTFFICILPFNIA